jgi:hypothetical protein
MKKDEPTSQKEPQKEPQTPEEVWAVSATFLAKTCVARARSGDSASLRLAMERACPVKERAKIALPKIEGVADLPRALGAIVEAAANGGLALTEATALCNMLSSMRQAYELVDMNARLEALERALPGPNGAGTAYNHEGLQ